MDIRKIMYVLGSFLLLNLLFNCDPPREFCDDMGSQAQVDDLVILTPLQATYQQGDEVVLKLFISADESYFGGNIYERTGDETAVLMLGSSVLFTNNELSFIKGSQGTYPNWFNMPYNPITGEYQLEVKIKLNRTGIYTQSANLYMRIVGNSYCDTFLLDTNISGDNEEGNIEFEVLP